MIKKIDRNAARAKRHSRARKNIFGTEQMPRLNVFRSGKHIYAQIIDDTKGTTLVAASSLETGFELSGSNKEGAKQVGKNVAKKALEKGITAVVFDRGGYLYHGRVKELADGAREGGLNF